MKYIKFALLSSVFLLLSKASASCCCYPVVSCVAVEISTEIAKAQNLIDINAEDVDVGNLWLQKVEAELSGLNALKNISLEKQKNITNLEYANLIESYKEELAYLNILEYKKVGFDEKIINNKLNLLSNSISIELNKIENISDESDFEVKN